MHSVVSIILGCVIIFGVGGLVYWQTESDPEGMPQATSGTSADMSLAGVAKHADATSCWSIINGGVYDLTSWMPRHPGGEEAILKLCGKDGSEAFNRQHGGAAVQAQALAGFKIGDVE